MKLDEKFIINTSKKCLNVLASELSKKFHDERTQADAFNKITAYLFLSSCLASKSFGLDVSDILEATLSKIQEML